MVCTSSERLCSQATNVVPEDNAPEHPGRSVCICHAPHKMKSSLGWMSLVHGTSRMGLNVESTERAILVA